jgi:hypothetical protein
MNMNAMLDMLTAQASAQNNTAVGDMIARMRSGGDSQPNAQELIAKLSEDNPMLGMLAQQMAQKKAEQGSIIDADTLEVESLEEEPEVPSVQLAQLCAQVEELRGSLQAVSHELAALRDREDILAEALGACCLCWGEDSHCRACRGRGRPGFTAPDEELFEELVLPAMKMLRACRVKHAVIAPMTSTLSFAPGASPGALRIT